MSIDLHVRVTSKGMQDKIQEYTGDNGLYENPSELVRAALRRFFSSEELKSQEAKDDIAFLAKRSLLHDRYYKDTPELREKMLKQIQVRRKTN